MDWINVIVMAVGLAMDCCAVSAVQGLNAHRWDSHALLMAAIFGLFHAGMPIIGFYAGTLFVDFMSTYAPWIALALLGFLGIKMIAESFHKEDDKTQKANWSVKYLLMLAIATSIDVLATGILFVPYPGWLFPSIAVIGVITAAFSLGGYLIGVFVGRMKINMEIVGGVVLILLGIKICVEGICF